MFSSVDMSLNRRSFVLRRRGVSLWPEDVVAIPAWAVGRRVAICLHLESRRESESRSLAEGRAPDVPVFCGSIFFVDVSSLVFLRWCSFVGVSSWCFFVGVSSTVLFVVRLVFCSGCRSAPVSSVSGEGL